MALRETVRTLVHDDLAAVYDLGRAIFAGVSLHQPWEPASIAEALCEDMSLSFVIADKKAIRGFLIACEESRDTETRARLLWLGVEAGARDQERAKKLLLAFFHEAAIRGISMAEALVFDGNAPLMELLHSGNFAEKAAFILLNKKL